jgi:hypothetical protein
MDAEIQEKSQRAAKASNDLQLWLMKRFGNSEGRLGFDLLDKYIVAKFEYLLAVSKKYDR